jgi:hypothetical protein
MTMTWCLTKLGLTWRPLWRGLERILVGGLARLFRSDSFGSVETVSLLGEGRLELKEMSLLVGNTWPIFGIVSSI